MLRRATSEDIPAIMAIERRPGYEALVGQWSAVQHAAQLEDPDFHYFVLDGGDGDDGITAFAALHSQPAGLLLNRIIVRETGRGLGSVLLDETVTLAPSLSPSPRRWLRVGTHNDRAIHLYTKLGFSHETTLAAAGRLPSGGVVDLMVMVRSTRPEARLE